MTAPAPKWQHRIVGEGTENPEQILANPMNFRNHPAHQKQALRGVLNEVGWIQRIIINKQTGHLIDGHLRVELALDDGESEVPVIYVDLTEHEEKIALASIDPLSALAEQDQEMLDSLLEQIGTVEDDGLGAFLDGLHSELFDDEPETEGLVDEDECPDTQAGTISQMGDVWILGNHRLMCGDSTSDTDMEALVDSKQVDMVWTDPPYNVAYEGGTDEKLTIENDDMDDAQFRQFLRDLFTNAYAWTKQGGPIYIAHADSEGVNFRCAMIESGWLLKQCIIWVKNSMVLGRQDYQWQHEPVLYGWKPGAAHKWYGEFNKKTVIDDTPDIKEMSKSELVNLVRTLQNALNTTVHRFDKPARNGEHPTMKPVELVAHMIRNSSRKGDKVLDLCGGSGTTMIACEKYGRHARIMEFDPKYADVIVRRWQKFTGQEAVLEKTGQPFNEMTPLVSEPDEAGNVAVSA